MKKYNWVTFNNVARSIYAGKYKPQKDYRHLGHKQWGVLKGISLRESAKELRIPLGEPRITLGELGIIPEGKSLMLFDNDPGFLEGLRTFPNTLGVCAGHPCSNFVLNPTLVESTLR